MHVVNKAINFKNTEAIVSAGFIWDELVKESIQRNLSGIECMSGIPGTVGGAPIQNIGAYGQELKDSFVSLEAYDIKLSKFLVFEKEHCKFGYRDSIFKLDKNKERYIIWSVKLKLSKRVVTDIKYESLKNYLRKKRINDPSLSDVRNAVLNLRKNNHIDPKISDNAGSFFKNPIVSNRKFVKLQKEYPDIPNFTLDNGRRKLFAGWLIENSGWKGKKYKEIMISPKHALIIINPHNKGTASQVKALSKIIQKDIKTKFDVVLEREVNYI